MHTQKSKLVLENILFASHIFLVVLLLAESKLVIPLWLQVVGRLHPLILHFPIVLLMLAMIILLFPKLLRNQADQQYYGTYLLLWGCVLSAITVIAGLFLSLENSTASTALQTHKWTGVGVFWLSSLLYFFYDKLEIRPALKTVTVAFMGVLIIATGHLGASLTHGENFITGTLQQNEVQLVALEEAEVFDHVIQPILENKCIGCHKASKQKGELRLDAVEHILKGGESGPAVVPGDLDKSLLAHHILLPLEEDGHMPPKSKPQLTEEEVELIISWIASGGDFDKKVLAYEPEAPLFQLASQQFTAPPKSYDFNAADAKTVESLNNFYRSVTSIGAGSPALAVSYFSSKNFNLESLKELAKIEKQIVTLNLNQMPLNDEDLALLSKLEHLERLNLNFANIKNKGLNYLKGLSNLSYLSISGNPLDEEAATVLAEMKGLKELYLWNTGLAEESIAMLKKALPSTYIETGYSDDGTIFQLTPPTLKFDNAFFQHQTRLEIDHAIKTTQLYYTLDGSTPDSLSSYLYKEPVLIDSNTTVKAKAFAEGWLGSPEAKVDLIKSSIRPHKYHLNFPPSDRYKGNLVNSLFDGEKGKPDVWDLAWIGFNHTALDVEMEFEQPLDISQIELSYWYQSGSWLFPPAEVEVWFPDTNGEWKLAFNSKPDMPAKDQPSGLKMLPLFFKANSVQKMRLVAKPTILPKWHGAAGQQGWLMVDELVIN